MSAKQKPKQESTPTVDIGALCRLFNLTSARIGQLAKDGVVVKAERNRYDLWQSIRNYIRFLQEARVNQHSANGDITERELRRRKLQAEVDLKESQALVAKNGAIGVSIVRDMLTKIGAVVRASILRWQADMPPQCAGLDEPKLALLFRQKVDEILGALSDEESQFWKEQEEASK